MSNFYKQNYYELFGLNQKCEQSEIKRAFYRLAKQYHPDVCKDSDATEKFKHINEAYQTLSDVNKRKEYDAYLATGNKKQYKNKSYFDVTIIDPIFRNRTFNKNDLDKIFNDLDLNEKILLYEYFWITLWNGNANTEHMLINSIASKIFQYFSEQDDFKNLYNEVLKTMTPSQKQEEKKIYDAFKESIKITNDTIKNNGYSVETYNILVDIINDENIFDNPFCAYIALKLKRDVSELLKSMETIVSMMANKQDVNKRTNDNQKMSHKKTYSYGAILLVAIVVVLIVIFVM